MEETVSYLQSLCTRYDFPHHWFQLGKVYEEEGEWEQARMYYEIAVEQHQEVESMYRLGIYYFTIQVDYELAIRHWKEAGKQGHSDALHHVGYYYQFIEPDAVQMMRYYQLAIDYGHPFAMCNVAIYYYLLDEFDEMKKYYQLAIKEKDSGFAMWSLGKFMYEMEDDIPGGLSYLQRACEHGQVESMLYVACHYEKRGEFQTAAKFYRMVVDTSNSYPSHQVSYALERAQVMESQILQIAQQ